MEKEMELNKLLTQIAIEEAADSRAIDEAFDGLSKVKGVAKKVFMRLKAMLYLLHQNPRKAKGDKAKQHLILKIRKAVVLCCMGFVMLVGVSQGTVTLVVGMILDYILKKRIVIDSDLEKEVDTMIKEEKEKMEDEDKKKGVSIFAKIWAKIKSKSKENKKFANESYEFTIPTTEASYDRFMTEAAMENIDDMIAFDEAFASLDKVKAKIKQIARRFKALIHLAYWADDKNDDKRKAAISKARSQVIPICAGITILLKFTTPGMIVSAISLASAITIHRVRNTDGYTRNEIDKIIAETKPSESISAQAINLMKKIWNKIKQKVDAIAAKAGEVKTTVVSKAKKVQKKIKDTIGSKDESFDMLDDLLSSIE